MTERRSDYAKFLPPVFSETEDQGADPGFLERYLLVFEVLLGRADITDPNDPPEFPPRKGIATLVDALPDFFYPQLAMLFPGDTEFLPPFSDPNPYDSDKQKTAYLEALLALLNSYVGVADPETDKDWSISVSAWLNWLIGWQSGWIGLKPDESWGIDQKREMLAKALDLYRQRGTANGLAAMLEAYTPYQVRVTNIANATPMIVGENTGLKPEFAPGDPVVGGARPFSFLVEVFVSSYDPSNPKVRAALAAAQPIIDREKPAHADCILRSTPYTFKLGESSTVGLSTLLPLDNVH